MVTIYVHILLLLFCECVANITFLTKLRWTDATPLTLQIKLFLRLQSPPLVLRNISQFIENVRPPAL